MIKEGEATLDPEYISTIKKQLSEEEEPKAIMTEEGSVKIIENYDLFD